MNNGYLDWAIGKWFWIPHLVKIVTDSSKNSFQHTFRFIHFHGIAAIVIMRDVEKVLTVSVENNGSTRTATSAGPDGIAPVPLGRA